MEIYSNEEKVRTLIGDRDDSDYLLVDDEIAYFLSVQGDDIYKAAVDCCGAIIAKYSRYVDVQLGRTKEAQSQLLLNYENLQKKLRGLIARGEQGSLYVGEIFDAEHVTDAANTNLIQPTFKVGVHDNE